MKHMKYLVVEAENEIFYELADINSISYDLAQNVLNESGLKERDLKPLETVCVILFGNGDTEIFSTVGLKMHFD